MADEEVMYLVSRAPAVQDSGTSTPYVVDGAVTVGSVVGFSGTNTVEPACAAAPYRVAIGVSMLAAGGTTTLKYEGEIDAFSGLVVGSTYYLSETPGQITADPPATPGSIVQRVGVARSPTTLIVAIDRDYVEL